MKLNDKIIYSSNSLVTSIDIINSSNAVMPYPVSMASYFSRFGIGTLQMSEEYNKGTIGIYIPREKIDDPHIQMLCQDIQAQVACNSPLIATF